LAPILIQLLSRKLVSDHGSSAVFGIASGPHEVSPGLVGKSMQTGRADGISRRKNAMNSRVHLIAALALLDPLLAGCRGGL